MPAKLKTEWKRIGRSGPTVDGRTIEAQWLTEAADSYDKELYTALLWPEHERWYNMGTIEELRAEQNDEGGVDLYALIAPNDFYLRANKEGQKLFTSMELRPNFRDTEKHYLTGCAATDSPASAATSEIRFSKSKADDLLLAQHIEATTHHFNDDDQPPGWFKRFFSQSDKSNEGDMDKKTAEQLNSSITALNQLFSQLLNTEGDGKDKPNAKDKEPASDSETVTAEQFSELQQQVTGLQAAVEKFTAGNGKEAPKNEDGEQQNYGDLKASIEALTKKVNDALQEQPGTDGGGHEGEKFSADSYI
ncbi:GPO family capsid scaffolding protein [Methylophaga sp. OBS4]|uniref:GPO family capsid scaffolding protein n=1 Tax=Methylophaga sp. OBS4 TaxID=2991935 RepID=UPI00224D6E6E|nr:GPO family capsid scaffolding protein [Methylophaga sp. OBS4]MCX4187178.1 GPO family capsid scaffolding protein [Methylophaga sp. OBS4]